MRSFKTRILKRYQNFLGIKQVVFRVFYTISTTRRGHRESMSESVGDPRGAGDESGSQQDDEEEVQVQAEHRKAEERFRT